MDNQHKLIKGYRDLTQEEIDAMNKVKEMGEQLGQLIWYLKEELHDTDVDLRWVHIAETHLQQGIMAAVRAIARPETF